MRIRRSRCNVLDYELEQEPNSTNQGCFISDQPVLDMFTLVIIREMVGKQAYSTHRGSFFKRLAKNRMIDMLLNIPYHMSLL